MVSGISSKDLLNEGVLGRGRKEILLLVFPVLGLVGGDMGKDVKAEDWGGGDGGTGDDVYGAIGDVGEGVIFRVVKDGPNELRGWGMGDNGLKDAGGDVKRTWVVPSVVRALKDLKDGGSGVRNVLLIDVIKGGPRGGGDV